MAETIQMLQKQIAGYVLMPTEPEVLESALAGMRRAVDHLNTHNWNSAVTYDDISFLAGQTDYDLNSQFKAPLNFEIWDSSERSVGRLEYKPWKTFLLEHSALTLESGPNVYSCSNPSEFGSLSLNAEPSADWVVKQPTGRIWYFRNFSLPVSSERPLDVAGSMTAYVQAFAEGYVAERHATGKANSAYQRALSLYDHRNHTGALLKSDNDVTSDWQGE